MVKGVIDMLYSATSEKKIGDLNRMCVVIARNCYREYGVTGHPADQLRAWGDDFNDLDMPNWTTSDAELTNFNASEVGSEDYYVTSNNADMRVMVTVKNNNSADNIVQFGVRNVTRNNCATKINQEFNRLTGLSMPNSNCYLTNVIIKIKK